MGPYLVTHATPDGFDQDRRIDKIGGIAWGWLYQDEAIAFIRRGGLLETESPARALGLLANYGPGGVTNALVRPSRAKVLIAPARFTRREHLYTEADGMTGNNLSSLPPVPPDWLHAVWLLR